MIFPNLPVIDLQKLDPTYQCSVELIKTHHRFSAEATLSGIVGEECCCGPVCNCGDNCQCNIENSFVYGTNCYVKHTTNGHLSNQISTTYGIPTIVIKKDHIYNFRYQNSTGQMLNIHYHGMNADSNMDGALTEVMFGEHTKIGPVWKRGPQYVYNNSGMIINHPHPMFESSAFVYGGMAGVLKIVDDYSKLLDKYFKLGDNELILLSEDYDLYENGKIDCRNLYLDQWVPQFNAINGQITHNWGDENSDSPYIQEMEHKVCCNNIVKLDLINATCSFQNLYYGVCDKNNVLKDFYIIETESGFRLPFKTNNLLINTYNRFSIIFDLNDFEDNEAYVFHFNLKHPEIGSPDITQYLNNTELYKKFLTIEFDDDECTVRNTDIEDVLEVIEKIVLGGSDYEEEYLTGANYIEYLNPKYFYNLPLKETKVRNRGFAFFVESADTLNGASEYLDVQQRIMADLWTDHAYESWKITGNHKYLPTIKFKIAKYKYGILEYTNYKMMDNHLLNVQIYNPETDELLETVVINFPETEPINIVEWKALVDKYLSRAQVRTIPGFSRLSEMLTYSWEDKLFELAYTDGEIDPVKIKTVMVKTVNNTNYKIKLNANWQLLNFFGKPIGAMAMGEEYKLSCADDMENMDNMNMDNGHIMAVVGSANGQMDMGENGFFDLEIPPNGEFRGFVDGSMNDNLYSFTVKKNDVENWIYYNMDSGDSHPFHFHLTSGFAIDSPLTSTEVNPNNSIIESYKYLYDYSHDVLAIPSQTSLAFALKFSNFSSFSGKIPKLGMMYHCHYMAHHDMNMMSQFFVDHEHN
jgi:FtsP/CotA-like multicopper oxidase with cupredoxin domain